MLKDFDGYLLQDCKGALGGFGGSLVQIYFFIYLEV